MFRHILDSAGFEIDSVNKIEITTESRKRLSSTLRKSIEDPPYFTFFDSIKSCSLFYISRKDSLTSPSEKRIEVFRGTLELYRWDFSNTYNIQGVFQRYKKSFNSILQPSSASRISDSTIWYLKDRSYKSSPQYKEVKELLLRNH